LRTWWRKTVRVIKNPWLWAVIAFFASKILLGHYFDLRSTCGDGWRSPSIGSSGACSWHGSVDRSRASLAFLVSILAGAGAFVSISRFFSVQTLRQTKRPQIVQDIDVLQAPRVSTATLDTAVFGNSTWQVFRPSGNTRFTLFDLKTPDMIARLECLVCRHKKVMTIEDLDVRPPKMIPFDTGVLACPECSSKLAIVVVYRKI
jgi:hypothetical protein